jgi:hypothetical protein
MDSNNVEVIVGLIVAHRNIQRAVAFLYTHEQTLGKGFCSWALLDNLSFSEYPLCLLSGNAAFLGSEKCVIPPTDAVGAGCISDN